MKKIAILGLFLIYSLFAGAIGFRMTQSLFADSASSTNNSFTAAAVFPTGTGTITPTATPTPTGIQGAQPGDVVINEIMWMGSASASTDEWVELRNTTSNTIDISGWVVENLGDGSPAHITIPASSTIPANGFYLISNNLKASSFIDIDPDLQTTNVGLLNEGEQLILKNNLTTTIDTANLPPGWLKGVNGTPNRSMERKSTPGDGTLVANWQDSNGQVNLDAGITDFATPKADNSSGL